MTMISMKLIIFYVCVCLAIYVNSVKCDEDESLFQYDGETSMSNIDDANKEIYDDEISPLPDSGLVLEHEMIYEQSDQPVSGERFIAVRVDKMGATENLKPNLVGLSNMAVQFLPKDYKLVEVIEATREIISGVRYELLVAARDENDDDILCRLVVTEITWKLTAWGDKQRDLTYSNCTSNATSDDNVPQSNDFNFNPLFVTKTNFINEDDLKLIEAQILNPKNTEKSASKPKTSEVSDFDLSNLEAMIIPSKSSSMSVKTKPKTQHEPNTNTFVRNSFETNNHRAQSDCKHQHEETYLSKSETLPETQLKVDSIQDATTETRYENAQKLLATTSTSPNLPHSEASGDSPEVQLGATESIQQENTLNEPRLEEITSKSEEIETTFNASSQPLLAKEILEHIIQNDEQQPETTDFQHNPENSTPVLLPSNAVTESQSETSSESATITEVVQSTSDQYQYLPFEKEKNEEYEPKIESVSLQMEDSLVSSSHKPMVIYEMLTEENKAMNASETGTESYPNQENEKRFKREVNTEMIFLENLTNEALEQLDYVDSDNFKRVALEIIRVKKMDQENGVIYVIKVRTANSNCTEETDELRENCLENVIKDTTKVCFIEVKSKRDINKVTKSECAPEKRIKREAIEAMRNKREKTRQGLVGAPVDTDGDDAKEVEKLVNDALAEYSQKPDSPKYGLHQIKSSTKQLVAGVLYKVNAEFILPNNIIKDCQIELLVQAWVKPEPTIEKLDCGREDEVTRKKRSLFYDSRLDGPVEETEFDRNVSILFNEFKVTHNKKYESAMEHATRLRIFKHNLQIIDELNRLEQGTATYGITEFADFTIHEYKQKTGLLRRKEGNEIPNAMAEIPDIDLPNSFDWRDKGAVSEVKNQGNCGSCWAFSVIGNIEGINAIKKGKLEEFSEQELVDCDTVDQGCNGGLPDNAYKAIEQLGGLETESQYPYSAKKSKCQFNESLARVKISGAVDLPQDETKMAQYLVQNGPLSIGINANAMQFYRGGISHPPRILCRHSSIDHGVLIVGFGVADYPVFNKTLPFWIVKNSWGPKWGEQGYYRVFRGANTCGLSTMVSSAVLE